MYDVYGIDSFTPANHPRSQVGNFKFYDGVMKSINDKHYPKLFPKPDFWGRYISYTKRDDHTDWLNERECEYIFKRDIAILLIFNQFISSQVDTYEQGTLCARNAITAAQSLKVPGGVYIFCNIDSGFNASPSWIIGWLEIISKSQYGCGIYMASDVSDAYLEAYYHLTGKPNPVQPNSRGLPWSNQRGKLPKNISLPSYAFDQSIIWRGYGWHGASYAPWLQNAWHIEQTDTKKQVEQFPNPIDLDKTSMEVFGRAVWHPVSGFSK